MKRTWLAAALTGGAVLTVAAYAFVAWPSKSPADPPKPALQTAVAAAPSETSVQLPIGQVVLFSSGVGYFQREGTDRRRRPRRPVVPHAGHQRPDQEHGAARPRRRPRLRRLLRHQRPRREDACRASPSTCPANPTFGQILNQARGEKVEVVLQQANAAQPGTMTGAIMGVEQKQEGVDKAVVNVEQLNLWCADGMRSVKLADVQRVRFLNPVMDNEVRKALETLTLSHDTQKKAVSLNFVGEGKRNVRVGYVIENPIWKTSYRLVLGKEKEDKPFLQGWAVVENATDEDWKDVRMALVSAAGPSPSRWTCIRRCTCRGRRSCRSCSPRCGPSPTTATCNGQSAMASPTRRRPPAAGATRRLQAQCERRTAVRASRRTQGSRASRFGLQVLEAAGSEKMNLGGRASRRWRRRPSWATSSSTPSTSR